MNLKQFEKLNETSWQINPYDQMRVPAVIYGTEDLITSMDKKVYEQLTNVATLPGVVHKVYAMPDAHWGYGFPIGGVAAFDPEEGGVVSAGGVGFDISCGVRLLHTGLKMKDIVPHKKDLADILFKKIPSGVGSKSHLLLSEKEMNQMLVGGAKWAVDQGYGEASELEFIEEGGWIEGANPDAISLKSKERQRPEMGTLGSGNHYLELQEVKEIFSPQVAEVLGLEIGDAVISIHCGSRGLGHQIGTDYLKEMVVQAGKLGIQLPDRELACAPILSELGQSYLGAMRGGINCALANRQIITHFTREVFNTKFPGSHLRLVYDVSHNTCKAESHLVNGKMRQLYVHRKGATRAFGPGHPEIPEKYRDIGQPVFIGGSMGVGSYVLIGTKESEDLSFSSACHGAGRSTSRTRARKLWIGKEIVHYLEEEGILIRSGSYRGVAEEAPDAYKNLHSVVNSSELSNLANKVAYLAPHICVKG